MPATDALMSVSLRRTPEPGAGDGAGRDLPAAGDQVDVAGAEEDEVAVGQPAQQRGGLGGVVGRVGVRRGEGAVSSSRRAASSSTRARSRSASSSTARTSSSTVRRPVTRSAAASSSSGPSRTTAIQDSVSASEPQPTASELSQNALICPRRSRADDDDRVHDVGEGDALADDLRGDRVDEVGHVVGDQADDRRGRPGRRCTSTVAEPGGRTAASRRWPSARPASSAGSCPSTSAAGSLQ